MAQAVNNLPAHAGDTGPIPGLGGSPGEGNGYPLQYSRLENPMDRGAWLGQSSGQGSGGLGVGRQPEWLLCLPCHLMTCLVVPALPGWGSVLFSSLCYTVSQDGGAEDTRLLGTAACSEPRYGRSVG